MIRVLIIEDDPMVADINKTYLQRVSGYELAGTVGDGVGAMIFLSEHPNLINLILLDVFMPKMDGMAFLKQLKRDYPAIDVIMVTAAQSAQNVRLALSSGVVDYIIKPFTFERLSLALNLYRTRVKILNESTSIEQSVLDKKIFAKVRPASDEMPKGIERQTLITIKATAAHQKKPFSTQELADLVGISRISMRKYLSYLESQKIIKGTLTYRAKGRPIQLYCYVQNERV